MIETGRVQGDRNVHEVRQKDRRVRDTQRKSERDRWRDKEKAQVRGTAGEREGGCRLGRQGAGLRCGGPDILATGIPVESD